MKLVPGGDNLVKGVQCYELFGGIALKNHAFSFHFFVATAESIYHPSRVNTAKLLRRILGTERLETNMDVSEGFAQRSEHN